MPALFPGAPFWEGSISPLPEADGLLLPPAWSQPLEGWMGLSTSGNTSDGKKFSFSRRTCSDPPITGDGSGHGVPLSCP